MVSPVVGPISFGLREQGHVDHVIVDDQTIIMVYNHYAYDKEIQGALETWEQKLNQILADKEIPMVISSSTAKKPNRNNKA